MRQFPASGFKRSKWGMALAGFLLTMSSVVWAGAATCDKVVISADPSYPPLQWYDGSVFQGSSIAIATRVFSDLHIPYEVRYVGPLKRVLALAQEGSVDVVTTLKITPQRQEFLAFGANPALSNPVVVFANKRHPIVYQSWNDLIPLRGAMALGNVFGGGFDEFMHSRLHVTESPDLNQIFKQLEFLRVDYVLMGLYPGLAWMAEQKKDGQFIARKPYLTEAQNYVAFSRASPCVKLLPAFDRRLGYLERSGTFDHLNENFLAIWRLKPVLGEN